MQWYKKALVWKLPVHRPAVQVECSTVHGLKIRGMLSDKSYPEAESYCFNLLLEFCHHPPNKNMAYGSVVGDAVAQWV
jgi:hypothetical protein